jgi:hypothetical protein
VADVNDIDVDDDDVVRCRICDKVIGYWQDDDNIVCTCEGFRMCLGGFTCLSCLEINDECE